MRQNVGRRGQELIARSHRAADFLLEHVQVNVTKNPVLRHRNERVNHRVRKDIAPDFGIVPDVGDQFVVSHGYVITIVTAPTAPYPTGGA